MPASIKNVLIGIFVFTAAAIIVFMLLFLHPSVGDNAKTLRVRFNDIDKVNVGTRVTFAGKPVGEVVSITELPDARTSRQAKNGEIYVYELVLKVDSGVEVFNSDVILLRTSGLLGERNVEINPQPLKEGEKLINVEDQILYAAIAASVEDTMKEISQVAQTFGMLLQDFHLVMEDIKKEAVVAKVAQAVDHVVNITQALDQPERWHQLIDNLGHLSTRAKASWDQFDASLQNVYGLTDKAYKSWPTVDASLQNVYHLTDRASHSFDKVDQILEETYAAAHQADLLAEKANYLIDYTAAGKGTVGQLLVGNEFYLRLKSILHKGEVVMDDMNRFGLLYHLDKRWQRLQGRRLGLLEKLSCPNAFAKYFNNEMDQISDSLSRVSSILNDSGSCPEFLLSNPQFSNRFSELLRRVENMEETLKIYNEQVVSQDWSP